MAELDALLAVEKKELGIPESVSSPLMLSFTVKEVVLGKLRECVAEQLPASSACAHPRLSRLILGMKPGTVSSLFDCIARGYGDSKTLTEMFAAHSERRHAEDRDTAAASLEAMKLSKGKALQQPDTRLSLSWRAQLSSEPPAARLEARGAAPRPATPRWTRRRPRSARRSRRRRRNGC